VRRIKLNKYLKFVLKLALTFAALYFVFTRIEFSEVLAVYKGIKPFWLIMAVLFFLFSKIVSAVRLNEYFRGIDLNITQIINFKLYLLGMFYNLFLPGGIGGDGYKIYLLNRKGNIKIRRLISAILIDRITGLSAVVYLLIILAYFVSVPIPFNYQYFIWLLIPLGAGVYFLVIRKFFPSFTSIFLKTNLHSLGVQTLQCLCALFILLSLSQNDQLLSYILLFLISSVIAGLPITVGGVGARELTFLFGARFLELNVEVSIALSLMFYLITASVSLSGSYYSFRPDRLSI